MQRWAHAGRGPCRDLENECTEVPEKRINNPKGPTWQPIAGGDEEGEKPNMFAQ